MVDGDDDDDDDSGKGDEDRQDPGSMRIEEGDDWELKEGAQGPWKPVPAVQTAPVKPVQTPEPGNVARHILGE